MRNIILKQKIMIIKYLKYFQFRHIKPLEQDEQKCFLLGALIESFLVNK